MEAKDKKREKKRKRKDRENGVDRDDAHGGVIAELAPPDEDGYISPEFDLPSKDDAQDTLSPPPLKRSKRSASTKPDADDLEDEEELALRLLRNRR
jgi:ATP-dependent RNA helicase DDX10/DBP4